MELARAYRDCLGRFPTGVGLVTTLDQGAPKAMTINSFASVSLDPALVLWSLDNDSHRFDLFLNANQFAINVLAADQRELSNACARLDDLTQSGAEWAPGDNGAPLIADTVARFECERHQVVPAGDHQIILGRVTRFDMPRDAASLVFVRSDYADI